MKTDFRVSRDRLLVKKLEIEKKVGSIILPDSIVESSCKYIVVIPPDFAVMPNGDICSSGIKKGDTVMTGRDVGTQVQGHPQLVVLRESDVLLMMNEVN